MLNRILLVAEINDLVSERLCPEFAVPFVQERAGNCDIEMGKAGNKGCIHDRKVVSVCR